MAALQAQIPGEDHYQELISCQMACPVRTDARGYVRAIAAGRFEEAYLIARGPNPFASICGRICGAPCEAACRRGRIPRLDEAGHLLGLDRPIAIRALKRFACEAAAQETEPPDEVLRKVQSYVPMAGAHAEEMASLLKSSLEGRLAQGSGERIAVIGAGPAGLAAAHDLALMGFHAVVFETEPVPAGMLAVGVPSYRLPRQVIAQEIAVIQALGVEIRCGVMVGREISFEEIRRDYAAVIVAVGAKSSRALGLPGERGPRVYGGIDLLRAVALGSRPDIGRDVVVIGGGNVAYDVARTVLRQTAYDTARTAARLPGTARVRLVSLEALEEMPADTLEILEGDEEGIERLNGWGPVEIERNSDGAPTGVVFQKCLRVYDENRRFAPVFDGSVRQTVPCDTVLMAVGQSPLLGFLEKGGADIELIRSGWPKADPLTLSTTAKGVFVAGDLAHGTRLLIDAVASGKKAARSVYQYLTGHELRSEAVTAHMPLELYRREEGYESIRREAVPVARPQDRLRAPQALVEIGYNQDQAIREASRCLDCGVTPVFDGTRCILCGGCADVCPTQCLKLVSLDKLAGGADLEEAITSFLEPEADRSGNTAIVKDEDRCIRCALCAQRCPADAISMERVQFQTEWRTA